MQIATQHFLAFLIILTVGSARLFGQNIFTKITDTTNPIVTFTPTGGYSGATWVDFDNDGDLDLFANEEFLFRNDGNGSFTQIPASQHGIESGHQAGDLHDGNTWGDFNNDGWIDTYLANRTSALFKNNGDGTFSKVDGVQSTGVNAWAAAFGDYDADGWLDLVAVHPCCNFIGAPHENYLFKSNGAGGFTAVQNDVTTGLDAYTVGSWSDFDLDGDLDLFIGSGEVSQLSPDNIYFNQLAQTGTADLVKSACPLVCTDPRDGQNWNWIDFDNDSDLDGFVTNYTKSNDFYRNDNGSFHKLTDADLGSDLATFNPASWLTNVWEDFDNDGDLDVFLGTDVSGSADYLYLNDGDGTFTKTSQAFVSGATRGVSAGDYDDDGDIDLFISAGGAPGKGLFQNVGNQHNWISLNLRGTTVNRSAIGAKVRLKASIGGVPTWQIREVSSQNSFCGSNSLRVHFGLDDAALVDTLIVEWSADVSETFTRLDTNQFCTIEEGVGTTCLTLSPAPEAAETLGFLEANPNPAGAGEIQIHYRFAKPADVQVEIFGLDGARIWQDTFPNSAENQFKVRSEKLQAGFYTLKVQAGGVVLTKGIVFTK